MAEKIIIMYAAAGIFATDNYSRTRRKLLLDRQRVNPLSLSAKLEN